MNYIVLDLEFNQPYSFKGGKKKPAEPQMPFEIIQIGAVKLDSNFEIVEEFNYFIKPQLYTKIHPIVEKLTGITNDKLNDSKDFLSVYEEFVQFVNGKDSTLCCWGVDDVKALFRNINYHNCDQRKLTKKCINIQMYATKALKYEAGSVGLKTAVEAFEIPQDIMFHDALNDAIYTAKVFKIVKPETIEYYEFKNSDLETKKKIATILDTKALLEYFENSLERHLTSEEIAIIKTAYKFGRGRAFEIPSKKNVVKII